MTVQCTWSVSFQPCGNSISVVLVVLDGPWWRSTLQWVENALDVLEGQIFPCTSRLLVSLNWNQQTVCCSLLLNCLFSWRIYLAYLLIIVAMSGDGIFENPSVDSAAQSLEHHSRTGPTWRDNKLKPLLIIALTGVSPIPTCITHKSRKQFWLHEKSCQWDSTEHKMESIKKATNNKKYSFEIFQSRLCRQVPVKTTDHWLFGPDVCRTVRAGCSCLQRLPTTCSRGVIVVLILKKTVCRTSTHGKAPLDKRGLFIRI